LGVFLAALESNYSELLSIILEAALGNSLVEKLCGAALGSRSSFEEQLCAA
jgi:hypothetical protein